MATYSGNYYGRLSEPLPARGKSLTTINDYDETATRGQAQASYPQFGNKKLTIGGRTFSRFRFVLRLRFETLELLWTEEGRVPHSLWTDSACSCADSANHIS